MIIIQKSYFLSIVIFLMLIITYDESLGLFTKYFEKIWSRQKMTKLNVLQTINFLFIEKNKTISNQFEIKVRIWEFQFMSQLVSTSMLIQRPAFLVTAWLPETLSLSLSLSLSALHAARAKKKKLYFKSRRWSSCLNFIFQRLT